MDQKLEYSMASVVDLGGGGGGGDTGGTCPPFLWYARIRKSLPCVTYRTRSQCYKAHHINHQLLFSCGKAYVPLNPGSAPGHGLTQVGILSIAKLFFILSKVHTHVVVFHIPTSLPLHITLEERLPRIYLTSLEPYLI